jgi:hypothetical protein
MDKKSSILKFVSVLKHTKMEYQRNQLRKMQLQALLVNVQSFIDQFSIKSIKPVRAYIDAKNAQIFPDEIKLLAKEEFFRDFPNED